MLAQSRLGLGGTSDFLRLKIETDKDRRTRCALMNLHDVGASCWAHASSNLACSISSFCLIHLSCPSKWPSVESDVEPCSLSMSERSCGWQSLKLVAKNQQNVNIEALICLSKMFLPSLYCQKTTTAMDPVLHCLLNVKITIHLKNNQPWQHHHHDVFYL